MVEGLGEEVKVKTVHLGGEVEQSQKAGKTFRKKKTPHHKARRARKERTKRRKEKGKGKFRL